MVGLQNIRVVNSLAPISVAAAATTLEVDTVYTGIKSDYATVVISIGTQTGTFTAMKMTESDTAGSGHADVTGFVGGTDFTLPTAAAGAGKTIIFQMDLRKRKRYIKFEATAGGATLLSCQVILSRGKVGTNSALDSNALALVVG